MAKDEGQRPAGWPEKWAGKTWEVNTTYGEKGSFTEADVLALYEGIRRSPGTLSGGQLNGRKLDRALQLLRKAGLIEFTARGEGHPRRWRVPS